MQSDSNSKSLPKQEQPAAAGDGPIVIVKSELTKSHNRNRDSATISSDIKSGETTSGFTRPCTHLVSKINSQMITSETHKSPKRTAQDSRFRSDLPQV